MKPISEKKTLKMLNDPIIVLVLADHVAENRTENPNFEFVRVSCVPQRNVPTSHDKYIYKQVIYIHVNLVIYCLFHCYILVITAYSQPLISKLLQSRSNF